MNRGWRATVRIDALGRRDFDGMMTGLKAVAGATALHSASREMNPNSSNNCAAGLEPAARGGCG
jgi:hypothetical protein